MGFKEIFNDMKEMFYEIKEGFKEKFGNKVISAKSQEDLVVDELRSVAAIIKSLSNDYIRSSPELKDVVLGFFDNETAKKIYANEDWFLKAKDSISSEAIEYKKDSDVINEIVLFVEHEGYGLVEIEFKEYIDARYGSQYVDEALDIYKEKCSELHVENMIFQNADFNYVLAAVKKDGRALEYASDELKNDKEIVLEAVKQFGWALEYASERLKNDKEIVMGAIKQDGYALEYASDGLKEDKDVLNSMRDYLMSDDCPNFGIYIKAKENLLKYDREDREKELLSKLADLDKSQAQQHNIQQPKSEIKARRKI